MGTATRSGPGSFTGSVAPNTKAATSSRRGRCFQDKPDLRPYTARPNQIALDEMNPPMERLTGRALYWARKSMELDLDRADQADEYTLNRILWHSVRGYNTPYPEQYVGKGDD